MHNSNSKKILNDTATTNLLEISPANQAVLNHNLSIAINADRPSYQNHFINHSFYPPLVTTSYNHQKHAQDVNDNLSEFFNQTTKTHENLVKKNPLEAQTYLQNRLGFLGKAIDPNDPSSALNQSGFQHVPVVDKFGQTHANFGSAQINNLKTLSDMWQMNNDLLSQRSHVPTSYYSGQAPASPAGPAPDSSRGSAPVYQALYESSGSDLMNKDRTTSNPLNRDVGGQNFLLDRQVNPGIAATIELLKISSSYKSQSQPQRPRSPSPQRFGGGRG